jgi:hypothetical protein
MRFFHFSWVKPRNERDYGNETFSLIHECDSILKFIISFAQTATTTTTTKAIIRRAAHFIAQ